MPVRQAVAPPNGFSALTGFCPHAQLHWPPLVHHFEWFYLFLHRPPAGVACYTPQVSPLKPMITSSPATMTGTLRTPCECLSIASMLSDDSITSRYSTSFPSFAKASRAALVCGQVLLPKTTTLSDISYSSFLKLASQLRQAVSLLPPLIPVLAAFALCVNELQWTIGVAAVRKSCSAAISSAIGKAPAPSSCALSGK